MLNTIKHQQPIDAAGPPYGANPKGTILAAGDVLTVSAQPGTTIMVWNLGNVPSNEWAPDNVPTSVTSAEAEEFGPFPGSRVFKFIVLNGGKGQYVISRDE